MEVFIEQQLIYTLYAFVCGMFASMLYDIFRIARVFTGTGCKASAYRSLEKVKLPLIGSCSTARDKKTTTFTAVINCTSLFICDLLYFAILTAAAVVFLYNASFGIPRWYYAAAATAGFALYYTTVGRLTMQLSGLIAFTLRAALAYLFYFTVRPVVLLLKLLYRAVRSLVFAVSRAIRKNRDKTFTALYQRRTEKEITDMFKPCV